jgi:hypothetical protein
LPFGVVLFGGEIICGLSGEGVAGLFATAVERGDVSGFSVTTAGDGATSSATSPRKALRWRRCEFINDDREPCLRTATAGSLAAIVGVVVELSAGGAGTTAVAGCELFSVTGCQPLFVTGRIWGDASAWRAEFLSLRACTLRKTITPTTLNAITIVAAVTRNAQPLRIDWKRVMNAERASNRRDSS